jgi:D-alanyl-lipoteichoic acid acyltransferase DltB (MBOAT superfamily)
MLFNSIAFGIFLPVVFFVYWFVLSKNLRSQNVFLLLASYFFYGFWDYRFLFLLAFSTFLDYFSALKIKNAQTRHNRKLWLYLSICINLGFLGFFKYYNFFAGNFAHAFGNLGINVSPWILTIVLPVGISFYTFHGISYIIDVYHERINPTRNFVDYAVFVSFFPLLVAGPIERARHLLPQVQSARKFDYSKAVDGMRQILWGLFKKIAIADACATIVTTIFANPSQYHGSTLLYAALLFTFQIYCDFSGYSDIALGTARLFGFELVRNFAFPYFSRDIAEFWRRWHISLSTWFRDYVYIPIGGSQGTKWQTVRNIIFMFLISGFWHGANWTFLFWGMYNALLFLPLLLSNKNRQHTNIIAEGHIFPSLKEVAQITATFFLVVLGWIFFRAATIADAFNYIKLIFSSSLFQGVELFNNDIFKFIIILIVIEWLQRNQQHGLAMERIKLPIIRWGIYLILLYCIIYHGGTQQGFIYFQF